ncbi:hypothetical protein CMMCAS07_16505 [Clavibacter michiganensis subsp. michiganensis]|uniref:Uncharacterized protein n=1 Tax=Clavibacter michiganensis subsp. michiganensis TaxID=33013 RepID=A0A251XEI6_CLAMM|nr:hypothetical protein CMMCAS07_16505 [Clavibacter michiganensis subsp. michiganensis]
MPAGLMPAGLMPAGLMLAGLMAVGHGPAEDAGRRMSRWH